MRIALLSLVGLASAAPAVLERTDYGFWNASLTTDGGSWGSTRDFTAWYYQDELRATTTCHESQIRGSVTSYCKDNQGITLTDAQFSYSDGAPFTDGLTTFNITQIVDVDGEQVTVTGSGLGKVQCGFGSGNACRAPVQVFAHAAE